MPSQWSPSNAHRLMDFIEQHRVSNPSRLKISLVIRNFSQASNSFPENILDAPLNGLVSKILLED